MRSKTWIILFFALTVRALAGTLSLDGQWQFTNGQTAWTPMQVPGNWDTHPEYAKFAGQGWYRRDFTVPPEWHGKHIRLHFGAVNYQASIYLNGVEIGAHTGGYTPFEFDVTDHVNFGGSNSILVGADNGMPLTGAWWHWGGISREVTLYADNDVRIAWQHITPVVDVASDSASVTVKYHLVNKAQTAQTVHLVSKVADAVMGQTDATVPPGAESDATLTFPMRSVRLWDFDHPNLYALATTVSADGTVLDSHTDQFGVRKVEVKPDGLYLNGERVRLVGFNRVSDSYKWGNMEPDELVHKDIDLMKRADADMARLMHFPQAPNLLDYLDEKGMLIFEEIPVWGSKEPNVKTNNPLTEQWLREMIDRDYNHPCIIGWSVGNELRGHYSYVKSMHDYIRRDLDTSRLLTYVSNSAAEPGVTSATEPASFCDLVLLNKYGSFQGPARTIHQRWPDKPMFFSEWGYRQIGANLNATIPNFADGYLKTYQDNPWVIGFSIWTFNDYRNGYKTGPASGNREWGVVDVWRRPKAAYYQVRTACSPVHSLTVANGQITIVPRTPDEVPSFALRGYTLRWKSGALSGAASGVIPVPDLKPGDPPWTVPSPAAGALTVNLYTPTGYDVTDATQAQ